MRPLPQRVFDFYALSRPCGLAFGNRLPIAAYCSNDGLAFGAVTRCEHSGFFGVESMRRRTDHVWTLSKPDTRLMPYYQAMTILEQELASGQPPLPVQPGEPVRPSLAKAGRNGSSDVFKLLATPSHYPAAWALNQVYLAFPRPDRNWALDCQTANFHARLWEAYLLACFREQGCHVKQDVPSPDFWIARQPDVGAWIEAVTANDIPYEHVVRGPHQMPAGFAAPVERQTGKAAVRFAKTLRSKLKKNYPDMAHVRGQPFALAIADFHAHGSMMWTREALMTYLYGTYCVVEELGGELVGALRSITALMGEENIPAGLFRSPEGAKLSAVLFSNAATIAKFNRMGFLAGVRPPGIQMIRSGAFFDRRPGALEPIPFSLDILSDEYDELWPGVGETWSLELEVFHNPMAAVPFPYQLLPECSHWIVADGEVCAKARYANTILYSNTLIAGQDEDF